MDLLGLARHGLNAFEQVAILGVVITAFISLAYAWWLRGTVLAKDKGTEKMQEVWNAIRIGADQSPRHWLDSGLLARPNAQCSHGPLAAGDCK